MIKSAAKEGVEALLALREITDNFGIDGSFSYTQRYLDFESYVVFNKETSLNVALALLAVLCVLLVITANFTVTLFVLLCVALVDLFLFAMLAAVNVTLNSVTVVNITIAIGLAVDYSAHIGHAYLTIDPPITDPVSGTPLTRHQKRVFKARGALG